MRIGRKLTTRPRLLPLGWLLASMAIVACGRRIMGGGDRAPDSTGIGAVAQGGLADELAVYNFAVEARSVHEQADLLDGLGYSGVAFVHSTLPDTAAAYLTHPAVVAGRFNIVAVLVTVDVTNLDRSSLRDAFESIARVSALPWLLVDNSASITRGKVVEVVREAADLAAASKGGIGMPLVLYPHAGHHIASAEIALEVLQQAGRSNVLLSLHLCHELKAGNQDRLLEVIARTAPYAALASINGADTAREPTLHDWTHSIMPLAEGDLDVERLYLRPLLESGYGGPILLHTYGLTQAPDSHLKESQLRWREMVLAWSR